MPGARVLLLPRNKHQETELRGVWTKKLLLARL